MSDNFTLNEDAINEIKEFDLLALKNQTAAIERVEDKIAFIEQKMKELKVILEGIEKDILSLEDELSLDNAEFNRKVSVINYKQMIFRNAKFGLLEELVFWKDRYIVKVLSEKAKIAAELKELKSK